MLGAADVARSRASASTRSAANSNPPSGDSASDETSGYLISGPVKQCTMCSGRCIAIASDAAQSSARCGEAEPSTPTTIAASTRWSVIPMLHSVRPCAAAIAPGFNELGEQGSRCPPTRASGIVFGGFRATDPGRRIRSSCCLAARLQLQLCRYAAALSRLRRSNNDYKFVGLGKAHRGFQARQCVVSVDMSRAISSPGVPAGSAQMGRG